VITVEAVRIAQNKFGIGKVMTGSQMRWAFENIDLTNARLAKLGATGLLPEIKTSCENHEGSGKIRVQQWDGAKWVMVSDWIEGNKGMIHPMIKKSAAKYAKEKGITPGCMKD
jgi:branched-chain amino acid transport system substrate-binding protein